MQFLAKLLVTNAVILSSTFIGKRYPSLGGLIAAMPLISLIVLVWLYSDNPGNYPLLTNYTAGVVWGIIPTAVWSAGALVHQWLLHNR